MKILQIFGAVIAIHVAAFILIFASPGCQTGPRSIPTPDATVPSGGSNAGGVSYTPQDLNAQPATAYTAPSGGTRADPIRPGSPNAAALAPQKPVANVAPISTYTVQRGDSLWSIAKKNNLTVAELAKANSLGTGVTLKPGQKLIVPGKPASATAPSDLSTASSPKSPATSPAASTTPPPRPSGETMRHVVQPGESLGTIARRYGVRVGAIAEANNITDPAKIRAGQELMIPGYNAVGSKSSTGSTARKETSTTPAATPPAQTTPPPAEQPEPTVRTTAPKFEIAPPPPGQDLDAGLKDAPIEVPTIKIEEPKENPPPKG